MFGSSNRTNNPNTNLKNNTKMGHWAQNQASAMAIPVLWPEPYRKWVRWTEEEKHQHGAVNLKDLERFCMKEWSLISYHVFSKLFRHYRRKLRAVTLGKGHCNNWVANNCGPHELEKVFLTQWDFPHFQLFYFNDRFGILWIFGMKDKKDKQCRFIHSRLCSYLPRVPILVEGTVDELQRSLVHDLSVTDLKCICI